MSQKPSRLSVNPTLILPLFDGIRADAEHLAQGRRIYGEVTRIGNVAVALYLAVPKRDRLEMAMDFHVAGIPQNTIARLHESWPFHVLKLLGGVSRDKREEAIDKLEEWVSR